MSCHPSFLEVLWLGRFVLTRSLCCCVLSTHMGAAERQRRRPALKSKSEKPEALILGVVFSEPHLQKLNVLSIETIIANWHAYFSPLKEK